MQKWVLFVDDFLFGSRENVEAIWSDLGGDRSSFSVLRDFYAKVFSSLGDDSGQHHSYFSLYKRVLTLYFMVLGTRILKYLQNNKILLEIPRLLSLNRRTWQSSKQHRLFQVIYILVAEYHARL